MSSSPSFEVVPGPVVRAIIDAHLPAVIDVVQRAYLAHGRGQTANPNSQFLRPPGRPSVRHIALPAYIDDGIEACGLKWIASYPDNIRAGKARASAVLILNDPLDGYPFACLEASGLSAARTAASAVLAANTLHPQQAGTVAFIGSGCIADFMHRCLLAGGWQMTSIHVFDRDEDRARTFASRRDGAAIHVHVHVAIEDAIRAADLIVFATTAAEPHVHDPGLFEHNPTVLNLSLRDLAPSVVRAAQNFTDDRNHAFRERTSLALAAQEDARDSLIAGTIYDLLTGRCAPHPAHPRIFSPFGLGVLDVALGHHVHGIASQRGETVHIDGFFP